MLVEQPPRKWKVKSHPGQRRIYRICVCVFVCVGGGGGGGGGINSLLKAIILLTLLIHEHLARLRVSQYYNSIFIP